jgi:glycosyltransferase involved in cell wall biosynthesis
MRVAHILRKYDPAEWGGTETAVLRLVQGLRGAGVESEVFAPACNTCTDRDPFTNGGFPVRRFKAFLPVSRISREDRERLVKVGGNLMSIQLFFQLLRSPNLSLIHSHSLNRIAGICLLVGRIRRIPVAITIHGGVLDLPTAVRDQLTAPLKGGIEWGKAFGVILQSRRALEKVHAVMTCNAQEAEKLKQRYPSQRIITLPHIIETEKFSTDQTSAVLKRYPVLEGKDVLLVVGRLDPTKNQKWLVEQITPLCAAFPTFHLVLAGSTTNSAYETEIRSTIAALGLGSRVHLTGGLAPDSPELIGFLQYARALVLPSLSETFGIVLLEAWACGTPVISSATSGAEALVKHRENGWLYPINDGPQFRQAASEVLRSPQLREQLGNSGREMVRSQFASGIISKRVKNLYEELIQRVRKGGDR